VFGWPGKNPDLAFYYPTDELVTASEIIFFWVARMIVAGFEFMGEAPFRRVYIHGTVRDDAGRKMSKSLGNSIDPISVIVEYSADALRFSLMMITATGQDVFLTSDKFEIGRNFGTKLWNAARYLSMQGPNPGGGGRLAAKDLDPGLLSPDDRHLLLRLQEAVGACTAELERCRFNDAALALYEFVWHQFCDWYVEYSKQVFRGEKGGRRDQVLRLMYHALGVALRLLHPVMPFLTEELWHAMGFGGPDDSIMLAPWPEPLPPEVLAAWGADARAAAYVDDKHEMIRAARMLKADCGIPAATKARYTVKPATPEAAALLEADRAAVQWLLKAESLDVNISMAAPARTPACVTALGTVYMPVENLIDVESETRRLSAEMEKVMEQLARVNAKLRNLDFVSRAPKEIVESQKKRQQQMLDRSERLKSLLDALAGR
jgi:valyl-tRNA synthetase